MVGPLIVKSTNDFTVKSPVKIKAITMIEHSVLVRFLLIVLKGSYCCIEVTAEA